MAHTETDPRPSLTDSPGNGSPLAVGIPGGSLTPADRLDVSTLAQEITRRLLPLKAPMRREVLRQVGWLMGEEWA